MALSEDKNKHYYKKKNSKNQKSKNKKIKKQKKRLKNCEEKVFFQFEVFSGNLRWFDIMKLIFFVQVLVLNIRYI